MPQQTLKEKKLELNEVVRDGERDGGQSQSHMLLYWTRDFSCNFPKFVLKPKN